MALLDEQVKEVEFTTSYPNREGGFTYIAIIRTMEDSRVMIWSPHVEKLDVTVNFKEDCEEFRNGYGASIAKIVTSRYIEIGGAVFTSQKVEGGFYFKVIVLDDYHSVPQISKKEVEKLFNCQVVD